MKIIPRLITQKPNRTVIPLGSIKKNTKQINCCCSFAFLASQMNSLATASAYWPLLWWSSLSLNASLCQLCIFDKPISFRHNADKNNNKSVTQGNDYLAIFSNPIRKRTQHPEEFPGEEGESGYKRRDSKEKDWLFHLRLRAIREMNQYKCLFPKSLNTLFFWK